MADRAKYAPGPARGAQIHKDGEKWTLIVVRELRHSPEKVWIALTEPAHLAQWAPFDADRSLSAPGPAKLSMARTPRQQVFDTTISRAEAPRLLEYTWGDAELRWELEPHDGGTRLTLWHNIDRRFIAWGAAGWHICFDVLDCLLSGSPIGRLVGPDAIPYDWQRLNTEYAAQFAIDTPAWPDKPNQSPEKGETV